MSEEDPEDWPTLELLPSMASLNVPEDHKTPMKGAYKSCAKSGQLLFMTRAKVY